jgi:NAD(P)H-dependent FMN reductase
MAARSVALITMSTRATRVGPAVSDFVAKMVAEPAAKGEVTVARLDLKDFKLPVYDEAVVPGMVPEHASFQFEHTKKWSGEISKHQGYVLVIPEYNWGVGGGTKNAIDYLMNEWKGKPVAVVSYGIVGGLTASEQVCHSLTNMGLKVSASRPNLGFFGGKSHDGDMMGTFGGVLGERSLKLWEEEEKAGIQKAFQEIVDILLQPNTAEVAAKA